MTKLEEYSGITPLGVDAFRELRDAQIQLTKDGELEVFIDPENELKYVLTKKRQPYHKGS